MVAKSSGVPRLGVEDRLDGDGVLVAVGHISSHRVRLIISHPSCWYRPPVTWDTTIIHDVHRSTGVVNAEAVQEAEGLKNRK